MQVTWAGRRKKRKSGRSRRRRQDRLSGSVNNPRRTPLCKIAQLELGLERFEIGGILLKCTFAAVLTGHPAPLGTPGMQRDDLLRIFAAFHHSGQQAAEKRLVAANPDVRGGFSSRIARSRLAGGRDRLSSDNKHSREG
jgi:hypothetical protein